MSSNLNWRPWNKSTQWLISFENRIQQLIQSDAQLNFQTLTEVYLYCKHLRKPDHNFESVFPIDLEPIPCREYWKLIKEIDPIYIGWGYLGFSDLVQRLIQEKLLIPDQFHQDFLEQIHLQRHRDQTPYDIPNSEITPENLDLWFQPSEYFGCLSPLKRYDFGESSPSTLFSWLARHKKLDLLKHLVSKEPITGLNNIHEDFIFLVVCENGDLETAKYLVELQQDHEEIDIYDNGGCLFDYMIDDDRIDILDFLLDLYVKDLERLPREYLEGVSLEGFFITAITSGQMETLKYLHQRFPEIKFDNDHLDLLADITDIELLSFIGKNLFS